MIINPTQFSVGVSKTINLGNFQSLRLEASVTYNVPDDGDLVQIKATAQEELTKLLGDTYNAQYTERKKERA